jgi:N utilization substance protein B
VTDRPSRTAGSGGSTMRRRGRILALRALYRADTTGDDLTEIAAEIAATEGTREDVRDLAVSLVSLYAQARDEVDGVIRASLTGWALERTALTDRAVLRIGTAELLFSPHVPTAVVIDEAIEIARKFGTDDSGRFVNGVLDRVAKTVRDSENPA